jgi:hypothetical protein
MPIASRVDFWKMRLLRCFPNSTLTKLRALPESEPGRCSETTMLTSKEKSDTKRLPMMPIRNVVKFPFMMAAVCGGPVIERPGPSTRDAVVVGL